MPGLIVSSSALRISIDRGGTFTDCVCKVPDKDDIVVKILSVDPKNYSDAPSEAIRQVLSKYYGREIPRGTKLDLKDVGKLNLIAAHSKILQNRG